jgi:hypothetical protein
LKLKHDEPLSSFAFRFNLRRYIKGLKFDAAYFEKVGKLGALTTARKRCDDVRSEVRRCDAEIAEKFSKGFDSVCAFVTFEDAAHRADCINAHKAGAYTRSIFSST